MNFLKDFFTTQPFGPEEIVPNAPKNCEQHQWELLLRTYSPPRVVSDPEKLPQETLEKALFGFTTLFWECMVGKETKKEEILGSEQSQLDELTAKAEQFGPQYFQRGQTTYILAKVPPTTGSIPVK